MKIKIAVGTDRMDKPPSGKMEPLTQKRDPSPTTETDTAHGRETPSWASTASQAEQAKLEGKPRTILFNLSGHGLIDMAAYDQYYAGDLANYEVSDEEVARNLKDLERII